ncbi:unnamed protein product [Pieris brassicae]|uniref:Uncharacterized protein n=1 Tax=Pieris brassicae TaxID=7116 RepID=A0A9P0T7S9_PIEBR|nr:unnamed protein product [Pieris brassicae]
MKLLYSLSLLVFVVALASCYIRENDDFKYRSLGPLTRIMRQAELNPPENPESSELLPPQKLQMMIYDASRKRREAKGVSGSLPTRKG